MLQHPESADAVIDWTTFQYLRWFRLMLVIAVTLFVVTIVLSILGIISKPEALSPEAFVVFQLCVFFGIVLQVPPTILLVRGVINLGSFLRTQDIVNLHDCFAAIEKFWRYYAVLIGTLIAIAMLTAGLAALMKS